MKGKTMLLITAMRPQLSKYQEIGRGGEAVIHLLKEDTVAKVFISPNDPQFVGDNTLQAAATERFEVIQTKLLEYPDNLPEAVVVPTGLLTNQQEKIFGYIMPMIPNSRPIAEIKKPHPELACKILLQLFDIITALHEKNIVIGDVSENNILIDEQLKIRLVDSDSMQFGSYICTTFTPRYTPPECLDTTNNLIHLVKTRDKSSDWYGFMVIAMRLFTNTDPYGGVVKGMSLAQRIANHITVFNHEVIYPATGIPLSAIPRKIIERFFEVFHRKFRVIPDRAIFEYKPEYVPYQDSTPVEEKKSRKSKFWKNIDVNTLTLDELQKMLDLAVFDMKPRKAQAIRNVIAARTGTPSVNTPKPLVMVDLICKHPYCPSPNWQRPSQRGRTPKWCPQCTNVYK